MDQNDKVETPEKRKRGRPPKQKPIETDDGEEDTQPEETSEVAASRAGDSETTTAPVEKKKRGRKPKDASILSQDQLKTVDATDEQLGKDVESSETIKKKRGRKPKVKEASDSDESFQAERYDGESSPDLDASKTTTPTTSPKKRGRKPKIAVTVGDSSIMSEPNDVSTQELNSTTATPNQTTPGPKKRGRKPKNATPIGEQIEKPAVKVGETATPKKRGRKPKDPLAGPKPRPEPKTRVIDYDDLTSDDENEEDDDDDEFVPEDADAAGEKDLVESEGDDDEIDPEEEDLDEEDLKLVKAKDKKKDKKPEKVELIDTTSSSKRYNTRRSRTRDGKKTGDDEEKDRAEIEEIDDEEDEGPPPLDVFDMEAKIDKWEYVLDRESRAFRRPQVPELSDAAIKPFLNPEIKSKKLTIYECPFCKRVFTYPLPFKSHLYSCEANKNVPEYVLLCAKHPTCLFQSRKKQELIAHYTKTHAKLNKFVVNDDEDDDDGADDRDETTVGDDDSSIAGGAGGGDQDPACLSATKKEQLKINQYFYVDRSEFKYTFGLYNEMYAKAYRNLNAIDRFFGFVPSSQNNSVSIYTHQEIDLSHLKSIAHLTLRFQTSSPTCRFDLKPFESHETGDDDKDNFRVVNLVKAITTMDWCPTRYERKSSRSAAQYLAVATEPVEQLFDSSDKNYNNTSSSGYSDSKLLKLFRGPNLVHLFRSDQLDSASSWSHVAILNRHIGVINLLKWRPDFGASRSRIGADNFVGYLLAAGSNGNAYVYLVEDFTKHPDFKFDSNNNKLNVFEVKQERRVVLKPAVSFGQCTCGDWSQMNGATQVALGYANGCVAIYKLNSKSLDSSGSTDDSLEVLPVRTVQAHFTAIRTLKCSKIASSVFATISMFSREVKLWNLAATTDDSPVLTHEAFCADCEFSLHSNDLFIAREALLKGDNRMIALDLTYDVQVAAQQLQRDETRSHSSLFNTFSSINAIDASDYLNKLVMCDSNGSVILCRSNDSRYWLQKNKLLNYSFVRCLKVSTLGEENKENRKQPNSYAPKQIEASKSSSIISINLERKQNFATPAPATNPIRVDVYSLKKIKWNPNVSFHNWYACASYSGFMFVHRMNEIDVQPDELI